MYRAVHGAVASLQFTRLMAQGLILRSHPRIDKIGTHHINSALPHPTIQLTLTCWLSVGLGSRPRERDLMPAAQGDSRFH